MTTQVFRAKTLIDAREAATTALGRDAVVLTTRAVQRRGLLGLLGAKDVEIAAASLPLSVALPRTAGPFAAGVYANPTSPRPAESLSALRADLRNEMRAMKLALGRPQPGPSDADGAVDWGAEMMAIREALELLAPVSSKNDKVGALLRARGIEGGAATQLARRLLDPSSEAPEHRVRFALEELITVAPWPLPAKGRRTVIAAVGPSGVGKTTTLAKLATRAKLSGLTVTSVTCDTFRVGGVEQTKRYASLLNLACETANTLDDLAAILEECDTDIVLVDTSGRIPTARAAELLLAGDTFAKRRFDREFDRHVLLCGSASARAVDAVGAYKAFGKTSPTALAITKLDETRLPAGILHAAYASKLPIALTCAGQRVPEDIDAADRESLIDHLVPVSSARRGRAA